MPAVEFYVVRHGKTRFNQEHKIQGWSNSPLTADGIDCALKAGVGLAQVPFSLMASSDLGRARQTFAAILCGRVSGDMRASLLEDLTAGRAPEASALQEAAGVPVCVDARLREWCYGDLEAQSGAKMGQVFDEGFGQHLSLAQLNDRLPEVADVLADYDTSGRAERFPGICNRLTAAFRDLGDRALSNGGGNVLVVTHSFVVRTLVYLLDRPRVNTPLQYPNASVTRISYDGQRFSLGAIAQTDHLKD